MTTAAQRALDAVRTIIEDDHILKRHWTEKEGLSDFWFSFASPVAPALDKLCHVFQTGRRNKWGQMEWRHEVTIWNNPQEHKPIEIVDPAETQSTPTD